MIQSIGVQNNIYIYKMMSTNTSNTDTTTTTTPTTTTTTSTGTTIISNPSTAKRDYLRQNERMIQQVWDEHHVFESDATDDNSIHNNDTTTSTDSKNKKETFFTTFPYPYMNGVLHIGHGFSFSKAIFRSQYERHLQKNVLLPFAFHCTGMPIQAVTYTD
jgi:leucyl-tRNA synthetase